MAVMSIAEAWPAVGRPFTVADLDRMPDDGHRYELLCLAATAARGRMIPGSRLDQGQSGQRLCQPGFQPELSLDDCGRI